MKCYIYSKCSTCRDALKWLAAHQIPVEKAEIRETPPSNAELSYALEKLGDVRKLLNTSSQDYRDLGSKEKVAAMAADEIFALIQENGNLCKRPFLIDQKRGIVLRGFNVDEWQTLLA